MNKWTRRTFITAGGLVGGGLLLGVGSAALAPNRLSRRAAPQGVPQIVTWIKITPENEVIALVPHIDMGQGTQTACAMMLAEELEADWNRVRVEQAPPEDAYANGYVARGVLSELAPKLHISRWLDRPFDFYTYKAASLYGTQLSVGSLGIRTTGQFGMLTAGAAAKEMLIRAAANHWNVPAAECVAHNSQVLHSPSARTATYGSLASAAALLEAPAHPQLKLRSQYKLIGTTQRRKDVPPKVNGTAKYAIDVALPDMLYAAITIAPVHGEKLSSVDPAPARQIAGVHAVVELDNAVAVVAKNYWTAKKAARLLQPVFVDGGHRAATSASLLADHQRLLAGNKTKKDYSCGSGEQGLAGLKVIDAEYHVPYLAHASMEPLNVTARIAQGHCEVWAGTQDPLHARRCAAKAAGVDVENVTLHGMPLGGGFGRRGPSCLDFVEQGVQVAKAVSPAPVKLIWSRETDMQQDFYRAAVIGRFRGALGADGKPLVWTCRYTGSGLGGAARPIYAVPHQDIRGAEAPGHLRTGFWRGVEHTQHGFFMESFVDELAHAAGQDPFAYRQSLLAAKPRHLAVLERAARMSGWGIPLPPGEGRGIAIVEGFGSITAQVAEVKVTPAGEVRVQRVFAVIDCGQVINPDTAETQIAGGIMFALSATLFGEITVRDGKVEQDNFPSYDVVRMANAPRVTVEFISSPALIGGVGEAGTPPVAPSVTNAIFAATGQRIRTLPLKNHSLAYQPVSGPASPSSSG